MFEFLAARRKAIVTLLGAIVGSLALIVTGNETLADVTTAEWLAVAATVLGLPLLVERVSNRTPVVPDPAPPVGRHAA